MFRHVCQQLVFLRCQTMLVSPDLQYSLVEAWLPRALTDFLLLYVKPWSSNAACVFATMQVVLISTNDLGTCSCQKKVMDGIWSAWVLPIVASTFLAFALNKTILVSPSRRISWMLITSSDDGCSRALLKLTICGCTKRSDSYNAYRKS